MAVPLPVGRSSCGDGGRRWNAGVLGQSDLDGPMPWSPVLEPAPKTLTRAYRSGAIYDLRALKGRRTHSSVSGLARVLGGGDGPPILPTSSLLAAGLAAIGATAARTAATSRRKLPRPLRGRRAQLLRRRRAQQGQVPRRAVAEGTGLGGAVSNAAMPRPMDGYVAERLVKPVLATMALSFVLYPLLSLAIGGLLDPVALDVIKGDVSQYMQNFFNYNGLLFSFFASQTYTVLYLQQESVYNALYAEVSEARSLLEQLSLVSQGRPSFPAIMKSMRDYANEVLLGVRFGVPPAVLVAAKPASDPLERILYFTSVGVPSAVYDTVRSLRQARGARLGASQRKLPAEHFALLYVLGALELLAFPLLGAGISNYEPGLQGVIPGHILSLQALIFACLVGAVVLTLRVVEDMRSPTNGLYNIGPVLDEMVGGLLAEVDSRLRSAPPVEDHGTSDFEGAPSCPYALSDVGPTRRSEVNSLSSLLEQMQNLPALARSLWQAVGSRDTWFRQKVGEAILECEIDGDCSVLEESDVLWTSLEPTSDEESVSKRLALVGSLGFVAALCFPIVVELLKAVLSSSALLSIREDNNAQWLQNFFTGVGFIFSLFVSQTFGFLYGQQEAIYLALYAEVSEAKALLEQVTLVCKNRGATYGQMLTRIREYVNEDLQRLDYPPAALLSRSASAFVDRDDPLESILYLTSVGEPSIVYATVRGLRQARGVRLGAVQRKLPDAHFTLLAVLGVLELSVFPVLAAGCAALDQGIAFMPGHILFFHALLFGLMSSALVLTLLTISDIWSPLGDTYNVRAIIAEMVSGLSQELNVRLEETLEVEQQEADMPALEASTAAVC